MTLVEFLTARLDEDEKWATALSGEVWRFEHYTVTENGGRPWETQVVTPVDDDRSLVVASWQGVDPDIPWADEVTDHLPLAMHIARHDPAHVLAEVAAKRAIVERCQLVLQAFDDGVMWSNVNRRERSHARRTIATLASVYADHPDYDPAWRP